MTSKQNNGGRLEGIYNKFSQLSGHLFTSQCTRSSLLLMCVCVCVTSIPVHHSIVQYSLSLFTSHCCVTLLQALTHLHIIFPFSDVVKRKCSRSF